MSVGEARSPRALGLLALAAIAIGALACGGQPSSGPIGAASAPPSPPGAVGGTSPSALPPAGLSIPEVARLECAASIGTEPPPEDFEVILGVVALPTAPRHAALGVSLSGDSAPSSRLFAKTGLFVRAGTTVEIVAPAQAPQVGIGWGGGPATPARRVLITNCPSGGASGWLGYAGGYWLDQAACATIVVRVGQREQNAHIGVGAACPGQQPPTP